MTLALLIAGIFAVVAGLLSILFGFSVREFSLGSPLIIAGTIAVCSGLLLAGLYLVVTELRGIARRLAGAPSEVRVRPVLPGLAGSGAVAPEPMAASAARTESAPPPTPPAGPPPWQSEAAARERPRPETPPEPEAPTPPAAPEAPAAPRVTATGDGARVILVERRPGEGAGRRVERRMVLRHGADPDAEHRARLEEDMAAGKRVARHMVVAGGGAMSAAERAEFDKEMAVLRQELGKEFGERGEFHKAMREQFGEHGEFRREIALAVAEARATAHAAVRVKAPKVTPRCRSGQREVVETVTARDGQEQIFICSAVAIADARKAMASARAEISRTRELSERDRAEALRSLDEAERRIRAD